MLKFGRPHLFYYKIVLLRLDALYSNFLIHVFEFMYLIFLNSCILFLNSL